MNLGTFEVGEFMQDVGRSGMSMMIRLDHERLQQGEKPWTVLLSSPRLGGSNVVRWDLKTLEECLRAVAGKLQEIPGDWGWLDLYS